MLLFHGGRNFSGAVDLLERYLSGSFQAETAPAYQAHYLLGQIFEKQGNPQAAATEYRASLTLAKQFDPSQTALTRVTQEYRLAKTQ
jgi:hypothetical protein